MWIRSAQPPSGWALTAVIRSDSFLMILPSLTYLSVQLPSCSFSLAPDQAHDPDLMRLIKFQMISSIEASSLSTLSFNPPVSRVILHSGERNGLFHHRQCNVILEGNFGRKPALLPVCNVPFRKTYPSLDLSSCRVTRKESGETLSGESILQNEQTLEQEMQIAIDEENYAQAAKIRDSLRLLQEDSKVSVLAANARFYNSFRNGDLAAMQALWSKCQHVCVVHPGVSGISGYDLVMGSWEFVWADYEFPLEIETKDVQVHVRGNIGYVTCIEMVKTKGSSWGRHFTSNVFEKVDGQWFICIHHASYVDM